MVQIKEEEKNNLPKLKSTGDYCQGYPDPCIKFYEITPPTWIKFFFKFFNKLGNSQ